MEYTSSNNSFPAKQNNKAETEYVSSQQDRLNGYFSI